MEKENNQNKKRKIKVKANTSKNKTLLLKKEFLYRDTSTLILKNLVKRKGFKNEIKNVENSRINIATSNIIKFNEEGKNQIRKS